MTEAFSPCADFTGIAEAADWFLSLVLQKAVLTVDEHGMEAAAGDRADDQDGRRRAPAASAGAGFPVPGPRLRDLHPRPAGGRLDRDPTRTG